MRAQGPNNAASWPAGPAASNPALRKPATAAPGTQRAPAAAQPQHPPPTPRLPEQRLRRQQHQQHQEPQQQRQRLFVQRVVTTDMPPALLTWRITHTRNAIHLARLCNRFSGQFSAIHVAACLAHLAHTTPAQLSDEWHAAADLVESPNGTGSSHRQQQQQHSGGAIGSSSSSGAASSSSSSSGSVRYSDDKLRAAAATLASWLSARALQLLPSFQARHVANTLWALARLGVAPGAQWQQRFMEATERLLPEFEPQHLAITAYAFANLGFRPPRRLERALRLQAYAKLQRFKPAELAVLVCGIARVSARGPNEGVLQRGWLLRVLGACTKRIGEFGPQELTMLAVGVARLHLRREGQRRRLERCWERPRPRKGAEVEEQGEEEEGGPSSVLGCRLSARRDVLPLPSAFVSAYLEASAAAMPRHTPQGLSNTLWALACLGVQPGEEWLAAYWRAAAAALPEFGPQALSNTLWAAARAGASPPPREWLEAAARRVLEVLPRATPQEAANSLWGLACLRAPLSASWLSRFFRENRSALGDASSRDICCILSACLRRRVTPGRRWLARCMVEVQYKLPSFGARELSICLLALARFYQAMSEASSSESSGGGVAGGSAAGLQPGRAFMSELLAASKAHLEAGSYSPQGFANTVVALAALNYRPPADWLAAFFEASGPQLGLFSARDLSSTLWALATLDARPPADWMGRLLSELAGRVRWLGASQLSGVLWSLARLEVRPGEAFVSAFLLRTQEVSEGLAHSGCGADMRAAAGSSSHGGSNGWVRHGASRGVEGLGQPAGIGEQLHPPGSNGSSNDGSRSSTGSSIRCDISQAFSAVILEGFTAWALGPEQQQQQQQQQQQRANVLPLNGGSHIFEAGASAPAGAPPDKQLTTL